MVFQMMKKGLRNSLKSTPKTLTFHAPNRTLKAMKRFKNFEQISRLLTFHTLLNIPEPEGQLGCSNPYCTTCGGRLNQNYPRKFVKLGGQKFIRSMRNYNLRKVENIRKFVDTVNSTLMCLEVQVQMDEILMHWLRPQGMALRMFDVILFEFVRYSKDEQVRHAWVKRCIELAKAKQDVSLIETLLVVVKQRLPEYPELITLIKAHQEHPRLQKAVKRSKVDLV
jgi:hypothetical protein